MHIKKGLLNIHLNEKRRNVQELKESRGKFKFSSIFPEPKHFINMKKKLIKFINIKKETFFSSYVSGIFYKFYGT